MPQNLMEDRYVKKGMFPIILAVVCFLAGSVVGASIWLVQVALPGPLGSVSGSIVSLVQSYLGFAVSGHPGGQIPTVMLLLSWSVLALYCRKRPFSWWMIPVSAVIFYTVYLFAMMLQNSPEPAWILDTLYARSVRGGSGLLLLAFILETLVTILLLMVSAPLNERWRKKHVLVEASRKRREAQEARLATVAEDYSLSSSAGGPPSPASVEQDATKEKRHKEKKRRKAADAKDGEPTDETLVTFELDADGNQVADGYVHPSRPIDPDAPMVFPDIVDGPKLKKLSKKKSGEPVHVDSSEQADAPMQAVPSTEKASSDAPVSGFLQAALSVAGQTHSDAQPVASSKLFKSGQLVSAVAKSQGKSVEQPASRSQSKIKSSLLEAQERAAREAGTHQSELQTKRSSRDVPSAPAAEASEVEPEKLRHKLFGIPSLKKKSEQEEPIRTTMSMSRPEDAAEKSAAEDEAGYVQEEPAVPAMSPQLQELRQKIAASATTSSAAATPSTHPGTAVSASLGTTTAPGAPTQGVSPFAPHSTARPVNGAVSEDAPTPPPAAEPKNPEDNMEVLSGVGGLSSSNAGKSALLNRKRLVYQFPPSELLVSYPDHSNDIDEATIASGELLIETLRQFKIQATLMNIVKGPTVTMFEVSPAPGVRVNTIVNLADNIALSLAAQRVRIVAPIPGKQAVGIEVPNKVRQIIGFKEMIPSMDAKDLAIPMVLGRTITGEPIVIDLSATPHLLIAGSTGSGKSVCVNSLICSILYRKSPKEVRLIMVDPKIVELKIYNGIPHLLTPVITEAKKTIKALEFCIYEMDRRYKLLQGLNVRNIKAYNKKIVEARIAREKLPYIAVIIDEFADLMATVGKELETQLARLAAMSRAVGIHLVLATQRPSVNVITGLIKSNIPSRIAFAVTSAMDSRIIIDEIGAEKLLGKGDMLYSSNADPSPSRIQGAFLSDDEVEKVVAFACSQGEPDYIDEAFFEDDEPEESGDGDDDFGDSDDSLMEKALRIVVERNGASASYLQRRLKIGYNRAARLVEQMEEMGYVGPPNGSKPRELLRMPD